MQFVRNDSWNPSTSSGQVDLNQVNNHVSSRSHGLSLHAQIIEV